MQKEKMKENIHKIGKIGYVISVIMKVFLIVALVSTILGAVAVFGMGTADSIWMTKNTGQEITVDLAQLNQSWIEDGFLEIAEGVDISEAADATEGWSVVIDGQEVDSQTVTDYTLTDNILTVLTEDEPTVYSLREVRVVIILAMLEVIITMVGVFFVEKLFKAFRTCESPFEETIISNMKNSTIFLLIWSVLSTTISGAIESILIGQGVSIVVGVDLGYLLIILALIALTYIFKYGAVLQQESDETL